MNNSSTKGDNKKPMSQNFQQNLDKKIMRKHLLTGKTRVKQFNNKCTKIRGFIYD